MAMWFCDCKSDCYHFPKLCGLLLDENVILYNRIMKQFRQHSLRANGKTLPTMKPSESQEANKIGGGVRTD